MTASVYYCSMSCKAQLAEETGRLNDAMKIYDTVEEKMTTGKASFMRQYDFCIGIIGIYLKRMELSSAKKYLDRARAMISGSSIPENLISYSFDYNLAEYDMLSGNEDLGEKVIRQIIGDSKTQTWTDRLLIKLAAAGRMGAARQEKILSEYEAFLAHSAEPSPTFELLYARLYFQNGEAEKANGITEKVLPFREKTRTACILWKLIFF
jgi:LuxR family maltose regulon positive regulatory protein